MILFHVLTALIATLLTPSTQCFAPKSVGRSTNTCTRVTNESKLQGKHNPDEETNGRRTFLTKTVGTLATIGATTLSPLTASAGIDLSGLSPTTTTPPKTGTIADQLRAYDTSPTQRAPPPERPSTPTIPPPTVPAGVATSVTRTSTAPPFLRRAQLGTMSRLEDTLQAPSGSKLRTLSVSFEFPSDWLQLDRVLGGVEFVDQRNGDKLYVLRAELPEGKTLETVEKGWFGEAIFDPRGTIAKGLEIDGYRMVDSRVSSSVGACPGGGHDELVPSRALIVLVQHEV